ncbi:helix-turn-helix domain-containing protein [Patescibacteria group bacterium]
MEKIAVNTADAPVAERLKEARDALGLTTAEASRRSGVPADYLRYLEGDRKDAPAADLYVRHRLKQYCSFLGLDVESTLLLYRRERNPQPEKGAEERTKPQRRRHPHRSIPLLQLFDAPNLVRAAVVALAAVGVATYVGFAAQRLMAPPRVTVLYPQDGLVLYEKTLLVEGETEREVSVSINGKAVHADGDGHFSDQLNLHEGLNVIKVVATKKHGKRTEVVRRIVVQPRARPTAEGL